MSNWKGRTKLMECRMKHAGWAWLLAMLIIVAGAVVSGTPVLPVPLSFMVVPIMLASVLAMIPYMWYMENKLQDKLNIIRKQYGLKEVCGRESFWSYLVRN